MRGKNPTEIHNALHEVCVDSVVDHSTVSRVASRFREGQVSIQDDPRSGQPVTATDNISVVIVITLLEEDRCKSCEEIAHEANMSTTSGFRIVTQNIAEEKSRCKVGSASAERRTESSSQEGCRRLLQHYKAEGEQFLNRIVAIDETWIRDVEPQLKSQLSVEACIFSSPEKMSPPTIKS